MFVNDAHKSAFVAAASALSALVGVGAGYKYAQKELRQHYAEVATREIREAKAFYQKPELPLGTITAVEEIEGGLNIEAELTQQGKDFVENAHIVEAIKSGEPVPYHEMHERPEPVTSIFDGKAEVTEEVFDYETELVNRDPARPYILSSQEFDELTEEYATTDLTWYEDDETLADASDVVVHSDPTVDELIGLDNLRFGYGSGDPRVVYIRNEMRDLVISVQLAQGSYKKLVLNMDDEGELEHGYQSSKTRRFRAGDDG